MRIAQVSPLMESVPPKRYGGTERIVHYLTEELIARGHDVTLFASGDSHSSAHLVPVIPKALRLQPGTCDEVAVHTLMVEHVLQEIRHFDIVHWHVDLVHFPAARRAPVPSVTTFHGRLDLPQLAAFFREFDREPVISISVAQRKPLPWMSWAGTVHHGLPRNLHRFGKGGDYLVFLGRMSPEKRPDRAIEIARRSGRPLKIAAKINDAERDYFEHHLRPMIATSRNVEFLGEIDERQKGELLRGAAALLFPIDWPEPFGLVVIESLACGTPVIASPCGSLPELIDDGETGFIVGDIESAIRAVGRLHKIDRIRCREAFDRRFSSERMAEDYLRIYKDVLHERRSVPFWRSPEAYGGRSA